MINILKKFLRYIVDLPKTIYFNYHCLPKNQARKLPVRISHSVKLGLIDKNSIIINSDKIERSMITLGYMGGQFVSANNGYISIVKGKIIFGGSCNLGEGFGIEVNGGTLTFGDNFYANRNLQIECRNSITFGNDDLLGWNVSFRDTDGHFIIENGRKKSFIGQIEIGDHVWMASDVIILKNSHIKDDCVIACRSTVCGLKTEKTNCLIAGTPAEIIKENIEWEE